MPVATIVHLPQPCTESWDAMTPAANGRHCAACRKTVVDFTHKTDAELLAYFRRAAGQPTCGRLRPDQLGRALRPAAPASRWRAWLASVLALGGVLGAGRAAGQARSNYAGPLPEVISPVGGRETVPANSLLTPATGAPAAPVSGGVVTVRGVVLAASDGQGLPGVTVLLKGSAIGTMTNAAGEFVLVAPAADSLRLMFASIGFVTQVHTVAPQAALPLAVRLAEDARVLIGELVITSYRPLPPWPWHARAFYHWGRYWLTRPFRRE